MLTRKKKQQQQQQQLQNASMKTGKRNSFPAEFGVLTPKVTTFS